MNLSHLGTPIGPMARVHGGFANRMYRLDTDRGSFAVKELNLVDRRWTYHAEDVFRFERAAATGQPWADELASHVETFLAIAHFVDTCERPGPVVLTHKDIQSWNLLARDGRPVLLDWELSGMLDLSSELGSTALSLAKGPGFDSIEPTIFRSVLDGYVAGGGTLPPSGPSWFVFMIGGWLGHTRSNVLRCLAGAEVSTGPDLALSHESARNGIRGPPRHVRPTSRARGAARVTVRR